MGVVNEPDSQDFTATFSQKDPYLNKVDIPDDEGSVQLHLQSQVFIPCGKSKKIVFTKMGVTASLGRVVSGSPAFIDIRKGLKLASKLA